MVKHGFPLKGFRFDWDYSVDYTPEQQIAYETMVTDRYEIDPAYFAEKYSMPVGDRRNNMPLIDPQENSNEKKEQEDSDKNKQQKNIRPFFD